MRTQSLCTTNFLQLKEALTPHVSDYRMEVKYVDDSVDSVAGSLRVSLHIKEGMATKGKETLKSDPEPLSLYNDKAEETQRENEGNEDIFAGLPDINRPKLLQASHDIPALFPFNRTSVYLLMAPETSHLKLKMVIVKGTSPTRSPRTRNTCGDPCGARPDDTSFGSPQSDPRA
jgi:hypothetical protein